jgi:hypothetical protein
MSFRTTDCVAVTTLFATTEVTISMPLETINELAVTVPNI